MAHDDPHGRDPSRDGDRYRISASQWKLFALILAVGGAGFVYALLRTNGLGQSAALYLGLPLLLALGLTLTPKARTTMGATMKGITIALLLAAPVFQEGYICILFAAPIFYFVGFLVAWPTDQARKRRDTNSRTQAALVSTVLAAMALEGTTDATSFTREHEVAATRIVAAPLPAVRQALARPPAFIGDKPLFLRIFPYPVTMSGEGLNPGDTRRATFVAYKHVFWNRIEGDAVFKVAEATERRIVFTLASDTSYVAHYLGWKTSVVELSPLGPDSTRVTWTLSFHRKYDPYWYFGTLQKYAVRLVAGELIDHAATPRP